MNIGIYGGSFNPIHFGHIGLAEWTLAHTDLDEMWLMVSPNNPLKDATSLTDEQERLKAVREAILHQEAGITSRKRLVACDFEFNLPRPNYTAHTLRCLQQAYPEHTFTLLIGEDNLAIFDRWREHDWIADNFRIFVYPRHHDEPSSAISHHPSSFIFLSDAPYFDISSTEIREKARKKAE